MGESKRGERPAEYESVVAADVEAAADHSSGRHKNSVFEFQDVSFTVPGPKKDGKVTEKVINHKISGRIESGRVLAILGPSGAGKSTLINALTLNAPGGEITGSITLDGQALSYEMLRRRAFVVAQQDFHWPFLTCKETIKYAASLYMDGPKAAKEAKVTEIIQKMGLESCEDTRVGNEFIKGLSGGQKRRLSLALALVKEPDIIFLDEPTSGLDAASAAKIMQFIKDLARRENLIFITTIHQPSTSVFRGFDQVMILSQGRQAFSGDAAEANKWFESLGYPIPANTNPADHFLDLVNADFTSQEQVSGILDSWAEHEKNRKLSKAVYDEDKNDYSKSSSPISFGKQLKIMMRRHSTLAVRDPTLFLGRCLVFLFSNIFFAIIYIASRDRDQDQVVNKMFLSVWFIGVPANVAVIAVYAYNAEFKAVRREIKNGLVNPFSYVFALTMLQIPVMFIFAFFALGIPAYAIGNYNPDNFGMMILIYAAALCPWEAIAQVLSVQFENPLLGMMNFVQAWFSAFIFAGFLIRIDDIVWPFRAFAYVFPLRYTVRGMVYNEMIDVDYAPCQENEPCFGVPSVTGDQDGGDVLNSLGDVFGPFSDENTLLQDIFIPLGVAIFLKIVHAFMLASKSAKSSVVKAAK